MMDPFIVKEYVPKGVEVVHEYYLVAELKVTLEGIEVYVSEYVIKLAEDADGVVVKAGTNKEGDPLYRT